MLQQKINQITPISPLADRHTCYAHDTYILQKGMFGDNIISTSKAKIFYINMEEHIERNSNVKKHVENLSICFDTPYERIEAITPHNYGDFALLHNLKHSSLDSILTSSLINEAYSIRSNKNIYRKQSLACAFSHLKSILRAIELDLDYAIILEDDFVFKDDEYEQFMLTIDNLPKDFDVMYLAGMIAFSPTKTMRKLGYTFSGRHINDTYFKIDSGYLGTGGWVLNMRNNELVNYLINSIQDGVFIDRLLAFDVQKKFNCYMSKFRIGRQSFLQQSTITKQTNVEDSSRISDMELFANSTPWNMSFNRKRRYVNIL